MAYPIVRIDPTTPGRERSAALWRGALDKYDVDPLLGTLRSDDFTKCSTQAVDELVEGWYVSEDGVAGATAEKFANIEDGDGVRVLSASTAADYVGVKAQAAVSETVGEGIALPSHTSDARGDVIVEALVDLDVTKNDTVFIGLAEAGDIMGAASALTDAADYIGLYRVDSGDLRLVVRNDNAGGTAVEYEATVVAAVDVPDGWAKLGVRVNADKSVEVCIDGTLVRRDTSNVKIVVPTAALPISYLSRSISVGRGATNDNAAVAVKCDRFEAFVAE